MRRVTELVQLLGPVVVLVLVGLVGSMSFVDAALANEFRGALVSVAIVVALYVFVGNSGVISFGHVSFVAVGAFAAGVMTIPVELKPTITPGLFPLLGEHSVGNAASLVARRGGRRCLCFARRDPTHAPVGARPPASPRSRSSA